MSPSQSVAGIPGVEQNTSRTGAQSLQHSFTVYRIMAVQTRETFMVESPYLYLHAFVSLFRTFLCVQLFEAENRQAFFSLPRV
jgi:hypothetical protein